MKTKESYYRAEYKEKSLTYKQVNYHKATNTLIFRKKLTAKKFMVDRKLEDQNGHACLEKPSTVISINLTRI